MTQKINKYFKCNVKKDLNSRDAINKAKKLLKTKHKEGFVEINEKAFLYIDGETISDLFIGSIDTNEKMEIRQWKDDEHAYFFHNLL